jgi:septal ring factor EnvC (AmiA/AmiB activator)
MKMILQEHAKVTKQLKEMEKEIQTLTGEVLDLKDAVEKLEKASDNK